MGWEVTEECKACGNEHTLFWPDSSVPSNLMFLTFICPTKQKQLVLSGIRVWMSSEAAEGFIELKEYKKARLPGAVQTKYKDFPDPL